LGVQFFFDYAKSKIEKSFPNIFGQQIGRGIKTSKGRISTKGLYDKHIRPYGWLNSLYMIAEKGIFKEHKYNEIDSVKRANLYKVLTYLSWTTAKNNYEIAVNDKVNNPNKVL
jgi:hypothetical protein